MDEGRGTVGTAGRPLRGTELRYALVMELGVGGTMTVAELTAALQRRRFCVPGRASKTISDALRWETARGRVLRRGRGRYGPGPMPRSTEHRIRKRVLEMRADVQSIAATSGVG